MLEVEVEVEVLCEEDEELELDDAELLLLLVDDELDVLVGTQDSDSETTIPLIGSCKLEIGVFGGALTVNVNVWPPSTVTLTVQTSADALGSATTAIVTSVAPISASTTSSFRLLSNVALPLQ